MPVIKILPETLSNKIAAGEVVERPASVVKELIENSLDAKSTRITVEVEKGGRSLIRVSDNGNGMNRDNALLSLERYATSKIFKDQDLFSIQTLGFRGEALPSIASVSRFNLITREDTSDTGTEVKVQGGKILNVSETGAPTGTMIEVKQLFFNTPARRKFLKSIQTEMGHIADITASMALSKPNVSFKLIHNGKTIKNWSKSSAPMNRIMDVLGRDLKDNLHPIILDEKYLTLSGWIASPLNSRSTNRGIFVFVNGRFVRDRMIQHALFAGYEQRLMKGRFPRAVLYIQVPFDHVDVNVHPTKNEVKFVQSRMVHDQIKHRVQKILHQLDRPIWSGVVRNEKAEPGICEKPFQYGQKRFRPFSTLTDRESNKRDEILMKPGGNPQPDSQYYSKTRETLNDLSTSISEQAGAPYDQQAPLWRSKGFSDFTMIGQLDHTYIVCESNDALILIDQHAAHERIVYEQLKKGSKSERRPSQKLLVPETIDLGYGEAQILEKLIDDFGALGLEMEPFGGNTFVVKSVPGVLMGKEIRPIVMDIVESITENGFSQNLEKMMDESMKRMACHGAIRAGQALSREQIMELLRQMDVCENSSHCPHGRPTWIQWSMKSIEKLFKRVL